MTKFNPTRRNLLIGSGASLLLTRIPGAAFAAGPTAVCSRVGQKAIVKGKNYVCKKVKGKLQWEALVPAKPPISIHPTPGSASAAPAPTSTPSKVSGYLVAKISDLTDGKVKIVVAKDLQGRSIALALFLSGKVVTAHSTICTHQGCQIGESGAQLVCPCHGSVFNAQTGAVIHDPAQSPLRSYQVAQVDGDIYITS